MAQTWPWQCHKAPQAAPAADAPKLSELALSYVGRFATSRAKLLAYLQRKLRERGWDGERRAAARGAGRAAGRLGYVDDRAFALSKARSLTGRGYGERRVGQALRVAGIGEAGREARATWPRAEAVAPRCASPAAPARAVRAATPRSPRHARGRWRR